MRNVYRIPVLFLCLVLTIALVGCSQPPDPTVPSTASPLPPDVQYAQAKEAVQQAENQMLTYTVTRKRTIDNNIFSQTLTGTASYSQPGSGNMTAIVEDTLDYGPFRTSYVQSYCEKKAYSIVNGCYFVSDRPAQDFLLRQVPAVLLDETLYGSVTAQSGQNSTVVNFSQPTALESWVAASDQAELLDASGSAVLDLNGSLVQSSYRVTYRDRKVLYELELTVKVSLPKKLDLSAKHPAHGKDCVELEELDAPLRLLQIVADVYTANTVSGDSQESIYSQALPYSYKKSSQHRFSGFDDELTASASFMITVSDYRNQPSHKTQEDRFQGGVFSTSTDGEPEKVQDWITGNQLRHQYEDDILSALMAVKYLGGAVMTEEDTYYRLELTGNDNFSQDLMAGLSEFLQVDLNAQAHSWVTLSAGGYVHISKDTGLPIQLGLSFHRVHTSDDGSYDLTHTLDQSLRFS